MFKVLEISKLVILPCVNNVTHTHTCTHTHVHVRTRMYAHIHARMRMYTVFVQSFLAWKKNKKPCI
jgi:hypothetical protein